MDWSQLFRWMMLKPFLPFSFGWCLMPGLVSATHQGATHSPTLQRSAEALPPARLPCGAPRRPPGTGPGVCRFLLGFAGLNADMLGCNGELQRWLSSEVHSSPLFCCLLGPWQSFPWWYLNNLVPNAVFTSVFFSLKQVEPGHRAHQLQLAQAKECLHLVFWIWPEAEPYRIIACWLCQVVPASAFAAWLSLKVAGSSSCLC